MVTRNRLPRPPAAPKSKAPPTPRNTINVTIAYGGTTYTFRADADIKRFQQNDAPSFVPTSGQQQAKSRPDHNVVSLKNIKNDYGGYIAIDDDSEGGQIVVVHDVDGMDTRWGTIYFAQAAATPTTPAVDGISVFIPSLDGSSRPSAVTTPCYNPHAGIYFQGTTKDGCYLWRTDDVGANDYDLQVVNWNGSSYEEEAELLATSTDENSHIADMTLHRNGLYVLWQSATTPTVSASTNGDSFSALATQPTLSTGSMLNGSRIVSLGNTLYAIMMGSGAPGIEVDKTVDDGANWTAVVAAFSGRIRDVTTFRDSEGVEQVVMLTENGLYSLNDAGGTFDLIMTIENQGRALAHTTILGKPCLLILMDSMRVTAYWADGATLDVSPGGEQGMPSGKDFGVSTSGQVCVCSTAKYVYVLWGGLTTGGSAIAPLIAALNPREVSLERPHDGWHNLWQKDDTSIAAAARFIFFDPQSGDLLAGVQDAVSEATTLLRFADIEVPPELQGTWSRTTAGTITTRRLDFAGDMTTTTIWDAYAHTNGLGTGKSIAHAYRVDGSTGAYTTVATVIADNTTVKLPDNSASAAGANFKDIQFQWTFASNAATDKIRFYNLDIGYRRVWPVRDVFVLDVYVDDNDDGIVVPNPDTVWTNLTTIRAATTLVTLTYSLVEGAKYVFPKPEASLRQNIPQLEVLPATRRGLVRLVFSEP